jgi:hypothetical protein
MSLTRAPPELPGLIAVPAWIMPVIWLAARPPCSWLPWPPMLIVRPMVGTILEVTASARPSGTPDGEHCVAGTRRGHSAGDDGSSDVSISPSSSRRAQAADRPALTLPPSDR